jgi:hypothetical protein
MVGRGKNQILDLRKDGCIIGGREKKPNFKFGE